MPQSARICAIGGVKLQFGQCPKIHVFGGVGLPLPVPRSSNLTTLLSSLQSFLGICCKPHCSESCSFFIWTPPHSRFFSHLFSLSRARLRTAASSTARQAPILRQVRSPPSVKLVLFFSSQAGVKLLLFSSQRGEKPPQCKAGAPLLLSNR